MALLPRMNTAILGQDIFSPLGSPSFSNAWNSFSFDTSSVSCLDGWNELYHDDPKSLFGQQQRNWYGSKKPGKFGSDDWINCLPLDMTARPYNYRPSKTPSPAPLRRPNHRSHHIKDVRKTVPAKTPSPPPMTAAAATKDRIPPPPPPPPSNTAWSDFYADESPVHDIPRPTSPKLSVIDRPESIVVVEDMIYFDRTRSCSPQPQIIYEDDVEVLESDIVVEILDDDIFDCDFIIDC